MRHASVIILSLLIQMGLLGRLAAEGGCCPQATMEPSHVDPHDHGTPGHSHGDCADDHDAPDRKKCPSDCGEHHHHDGTCIHSMQLSLTADNPCRLIPPRFLTMGCDRLHLRAPESPVFEMDKPPLI
jgi:hypothetical protein